MQIPDTCWARILTERPAEPQRVFLFSVFLVSGVTPYFRPGMWCPKGRHSRVSTLGSDDFIPQRSKSEKKADGFCKICVFLCKMASNRAEMSSFVPGKLSLGPLFSYTFPDRPSFLTSFRLRFPLCLFPSAATRGCSYQFRSNAELRPPSPPPDR